MGSQMPEQQSVFCWQAAPSDAHFVPLQAFVIVSQLPPQHWASWLQGAPSAPQPPPPPHAPELQVLPQQSVSCMQGAPSPPQLNDAHVPRFGSHTPVQQSLSCLHDSPESTQVMGRQ